ncbi:MAG: biotin/lipoyl-binding protein [Lachnospiraceae bacterium]|nr:biotin/lipoyl-binding protein [Lachnospiraceae bacterium]
MSGNRKKKIVAGFFVFLIFMWFCTVTSKSIYASKLPIVATESIQQKYVEHIVKVDGIVIAGEKSPVTALSGLRVENLAVQVGDQVEEGDVLFTIDMEDLSQIIEEKQTAISKLQAQIDTIVHNEELARQKKELEEQRAREDYDALARREDTLVGRGAEEVNQAEKDLENAGDDEALRDALQQAAYAEADAKWQRETAMKEAERKVEDITTPESEDSTLTVNRLELADLQADLSLFLDIREAEGQIKAPGSGTITDIYINTGGRTSDSAVLLLADDSVPCQFKTTLTQEQKKYVGLNDEVSLKLDGSSREKEAAVDYLSESSTMPGNYEVYINLPEGTGVPGLSGTMSRAESGEKHSCCVTPAAVHEEGSRNYVYVVKERDGILGKEYYAEQVNVRVLDENEYWTAVEGALDDDSVIISSSTKEVKNGDAVRLSED